MKKLVFAITLIMISLFFFSGRGDQADPIVLPAVDEITSVEIVNGNEDMINKDEVWIAAFFEKISKAVPTVKASTQDVPTVSVYTRVDFVSSGKISSIFVFKEGSKYFIEQPYQGIYETDETILDFLEADQQ